MSVERQTPFAPESQMAPAAHDLVEAGAPEETAADWFPGDATGCLAQTAPNASAPGAPARAPGDPVGTVMLAEPLPSARGTREREFVREGFAVFTIADAGELVRWLLQVEPDALVLDRRMAGPSGEVVQWMREHPPLRRTACYVLVLVPGEEDRQMLLEAGADWYIDKNALVNPLATVVRAGLEPGILGPLPPPRLAPRIRVAQPVEFLHAGRVASGETLNISQTGMFLKTPCPLDPGAQTLLGFSLPGQRRWECFARVAWCCRPEEDLPHPAGMGLQFLELEPDARAALAVSLASRGAAASGAAA